MAASASIVCIVIFLSFVSLCSSQFDTGCPYGPLCFPYPSYCDVEVAGNPIITFSGQQDASHDGSSVLEIEHHALFITDNNTAATFKELKHTQECHLISFRQIPDFKHGFVYIVGDKINRCELVDSKIPFIRYTYHHDYDYPIAVPIYESVIDETQVLLSPHDRTGQREILVKGIQFGPRSDYLDVIFVFGEFKFTTLSDMKVSYNIFRMEISYDGTGQVNGTSYEHFGGEIFTIDEQPIRTAFWDPVTSVLYIGGDFAIDDDPLKSFLPPRSDAEGLFFLARAWLDSEGRFAVPNVTWIPEAWDVTSDPVGPIYDLFQNCGELYAGGLQDPKGKPGTSLLWGGYAIRNAPLDGGIAACPLGSYEDCWNEDGNWTTPNKGSRTDDFGYLPNQRLCGKNDFILIESISFVENEFQIGEFGTYFFGGIFEGPGTGMVDGKLVCASDLNENFVRFDGESFIIDPSSGFEMGHRALIGNSEVFETYTTCLFPDLAFVSGKFQLGFGAYSVSHDEWISSTFNADGRPRVASIVQGLYDECPLQGFGKQGAEGLCGCVPVNQPSPSPSPSPAPPSPTPSFSPSPSPSPSPTNIPDLCSTGSSDPVFAEGSYDCVATLGNETYYGELHIDTAYTFNIVEWFDSSGTYNVPLPCDMTFNYTYDATTNTLTLTYLGGGDCSACTNNSWYNCEDQFVYQVVLTPTQCQDFIGWIAIDGSFVNCTFINDCPRQFQPGTYECFDDLESEGNGAPFTHHIYDVWIGDDGHVYEIGDIQENCIWENDATLYNKYLYFESNEATCEIPEECSPFGTCPLNYTNPNFYFNQSDDGYHCRSWGATDILGVDYRCVWLNNCGRQIQDGYYGCFEYNEDTTLGSEVVEIKVNGDAMFLYFSDSNCVATLNFEVYASHIELSNIECSSACDADGITLCDANVTNFTNFRFADPFQCSNFIFDSLQNSTIECVGFGEAQLVYYDDSCCTQMTATVPMLLTGENYPRLGAVSNMSSCRQEVICDIDPTSDECLAIRDPSLDYDTYYLRYDSYNCVQETKFRQDNNLLSTPVPEVWCSTECRQSEWFPSCYYHFIPRAPLNVPGQITASVCPPDGDFVLTVIAL